MDISNDEVRRAVADTDRAHRAARPVFERALDEAFDPDAALDDGEKRRLVGLPDRRGFLRVGGLSIAASAVLVACTQPREKAVLTQTGTLAPTTTTKTKPNPGSAEMDATLLLTAISIEHLLIDAYSAAIDREWLTSATLLSVANTFRDQHRDHAASLATQAGRLGLQPGDTANPYLQSKVVDPEATKIAELAKGSDTTAREAAALKLALDLEDLAAQTYTEAGGVLTTPALRLAIMAVGGVEARHYAVLASILDQPPAPLPFEHTGGAADADAYVRVDLSASPGTTAPSPASSSTSATSSTTRR